MKDSTQNVRQHNIKQMKQELNENKIHNKKYKCKNTELNSDTFTIVEMRLTDSSTVLGVFISIQCCTIAAVHLYSYVE